MCYSRNNSTKLISNVGRLRVSNKQVNIISKYDKVCEVYKMFATFYIGLAINKSACWSRQFGEDHKSNN
jgi:hypothetical protein